MYVYTKKKKTEQNYVMVYRFLLVDKRILRALHESLFTTLDRTVAHYGSAVYTVEILYGSIKLYGPKYGNGNDLK